jgi:DNA-directed RNA polymerase subunit RPC12/RpoP
MPRGIPKTGINTGWFKKGHNVNLEQNHFCKHCGRDLNQLKNKVFICGTCSWKNKYFDNLYWKVLERDNYICKCCGKKIDKNKQRQFNVHHIDGNCKNNVLDNLEMLCIPCHSNKRIAKCLDCGIEFNAKSAPNVRCGECSKKRTMLLGLLGQARFWEKKNFKKHIWYINKHKELSTGKNVDKNVKKS